MSTAERQALTGTHCLITFSYSSSNVSAKTPWEQYGQVAYGQLAAFSILYTAPVILLYSALSKVLGGGFSLTGAVKG